MNMYITVISHRYAIEFENDENSTQSYQSLQKGGGGLGGELVLKPHEDGESCTLIFNYMHAHVYIYIYIYI
jgi:hypothetical protein